MSGGLLAGRSALVTGGGSGIGRATALAMAREGAWVAVADITVEGAQETARLIEAAGGQASALAVDVTDEASVAAMVAATVAAHGGLDCAFNNAGIAPAKVGPYGQKIADVTRESWDGLMAVNVTGVFLCLKHEVLHMRAHGGGAIVNTASVAGLLGLATGAAYPASKHAVMGLTKTAALDHAEDKVRVNAICPGYVATPMTVTTQERHGNRIMARVPQARFGVPEEIAEVVVFLCSDRAAFVTGSCWTADGGYSAV
jgi:NAD(P)-dependent dehydrogenase (short-subunit alcohol dehydrogenase family)